MIDRFEARGEPATLWLKTKPRFFAFVRALVLFAAAAIAWLAGDPGPAFGRLSGLSSSAFC